MPLPMCVYFHYLSSLKKCEDARRRPAIVRGVVVRLRLRLVKWKLKVEKIGRFFTYLGLQMLLKEAVSLTLLIGFG
jgi:hypothetical protein